MKRLIFWLCVLAPVTLPAQQYVVLVKPVKHGKASAPAGAILLLIKKEKRNFVSWFLDTLPVNETDFKKKSFPGNTVVSPNDFFQSDNEAHKLTITVAHLREIGNDDTVFLHDGDGKKVGTLQGEKIDMTFDSIPGKLRLSVNENPDVFFIAAQWVKQHPATPMKTKARNPDTTSTQAPTSNVGRLNTNEVPAWPYLALGLALLILVILVIILIMSKKNKKRVVNSDREFPGKSTIVDAPHQGFQPEQSEWRRLTNDLRDQGDKLSEMQRQLRDVQDILKQLGAAKGEDKQQIEELRRQLSAQEAEVQRRDATIFQKENDFREQQQNLSFYTENVKRMGELQDIARAHIDTFKVFRGIGQQANKLYEETHGGDPLAKPAAFMAHILVKYQLGIVHAPLEKWEQRCNELLETGCLLDQELIRGLTKQELGPEGRKDHFKRLLFKEILEPWTNASLLLCEELKNLDRFIGSEEVASMRSRILFGQLEQGLRDVLRNLDVQLNYLPLFSSYIEYDNLVQGVNGSLGFMYQEITSLTRDQVVEIKEFGISLGREGKPPKTKIVIKK